jgi:DNA mismatch endonuclease (patch repair protein)
MKRSAIMRAVKSADTKPEIIVRKLVHALGYRFRLHRKSLPGSPDLVFPSRKKVLFVHGCFWHAHRCKRGHRVPKTNTSYWLAKIGRNKARDARQIAALKRAGWRSLVIWECQLRKTDLSKRLRTFLG